MSNNSANIPTGTAGTILQGQGTNTALALSTATYPSTTTENQILYSSATNTVSGLATANNGLLITSATGVPSVLANGTTGQILTATTGSPPSWAAAPSSGIPTIGSSTANGIVTWSGTGGAAVLSTAATVSSLGVIAAQGTAATSSLPAYTFLNDPDTGMYSDVANQLKFTAGGTLGMTMTAGAITTFIGVNVNGGNFTFAKGFIGIVRSVAGNITGATTDYCLNVTSTASARTVTVPNVSNSNQIYVIKDGSGAAGTNNITVTTPGGTVTIDGATTYVINTNWGSVTLIFDGTNYLIIGKS